MTCWTFAHLVGDRHADFLAGHGHFGFLDPIHAANVLEVHVGELGAGHEGVGGPEGRFHDAAGGTEDGSRAGVDPERIVGVFVGQVEEVDARGLDHAGEFPGGDGDVDVLDSRRRTCSRCG